MTQITKYILTDEQQAALWKYAGIILDASVPQAYQCFMEIFGFEPTNKDLHDFRFILEGIQAEKEGQSVTESGARIFRMLQGGSGEVS